MRATFVASEATGWVEKAVSGESVLELGSLYAPLSLLFH
jgi:hypothetical protein